MAKRYALKGINDDVDFCDVCGKQGLKRVAWLIELNEEGEEAAAVPFNCGTTCASHLLGYTHSKVRTKFKNYDAEVARQRRKLMQRSDEYKKYSECLNELNRLDLFGRERWEHPLFDKMEAHHEAAREWAHAQEIAIEL